MGQGALYFDEREVNGEDYNYVIFFTNVVVW